MSASVPQTVPVFATLQDNIDDILAANENTPNAEISALATELGMFGSGKTQAYGIDIIGFHVNNDPILTRTSASALSLSAGTVWVCNSGQTVRLPRQNTGATTINAANIDTGAMVIGVYYIYICADAVANTFTVAFSTSASTPTGFTNYELYGWFYNESNGSFDVTSGFFGHVRRNKSVLPNSCQVVSNVHDTISDTSYGTQVTGTTIHFYSSGRPVLVQGYVYDPTQTGGNKGYILNMDAATVSDSEVQSNLSSSAASQVPISFLFQGANNLAAGAHTVFISGKVQSANNTIFKKLLQVMEL